ncbi:MAG: MATE family efflux transporter, partial [Chitinophagaceae bacterium]
MSRLASWYKFTIRALKGEPEDLTKGSIRAGVLLLAIPMMLEMAMESVFAVVDLYFVGHLEHSSFAVQTVGLTESVLAFVYSIAMGLSMATTAIVARRIGENEPEKASRSGIQALFIGMGVNLFIAIPGIIYAEEILMLMGSSATSAAYGKTFTQIMMGSTFIIMLLFLINAIFRGAGNAAMAMKSLWISSIANIILCPILINGFGPVPAFGLVGAALATTIGRSFGVVYQFWHLFNGKHHIRVVLSYFKPDFAQIKALVLVAYPAVFQFAIASCSWTFLANLVATTGGDEGSAGYQTAMRLMMFFMLPAWGLSGAAATLVGQNLGAKQVERAERSVYVTAKFNLIYMGAVMLISMLLAPTLAHFFSNDSRVQEISIQAMRIMASG